MSKFFHSCVKAKHIGDGSADALRSWIEAFVRVLFPDLGLEYWSERAHTDFKFGRALPTTGGDRDSLHHIACYVRSGNESPIITIALVLRSGEVLNLAWAKVFDRRATCWEVCDAISAALEEIFFCQQVPELVELDKKLPRTKHMGDYRASISEPIILEVGPSELTVRTRSGTVLDARDFSSHGDAAHFSVNAHRRDWERVLVSGLAQWSVQEQPQALAN